MAPRPGTGLQGRASALRSRLIADAKPRAPSKGHNLVEMTGQVVGTWFVLTRAGSTDEGAMWLCQCTKCGFDRQWSGYALRHKRCACGRCDGRTRGDKPTVMLVQLPSTKPVDVDERPVTTMTVRCSSCQSFQGFVSGRCVNCGRRTADLLPHVDGRRCG